eukprot:UN00251
MIIGSSLCVIFMVIGILLGIWIQRKHDAYHTVTNVVMEEEKPIVFSKFASPNFRPEQASSVFNEIFGALWPDLAKSLETWLLP